MSVLIMLATAAVTVAALGVNIASGQTEIRLLVPFADQKITLVDVAEDGVGPGDRALVGGPLLDESQDQVGRYYADCVVARRHHGSRLYVCSQVLVLEDGEITIQGLDPQGPSVSSFAVTGGTGAFSSARGDGTWTDTEEGMTDILIHLAD